MGVLVRVCFSIYDLNLVQGMCLLMLRKAFIQALYAVQLLGHRLPTDRDASVTAVGRYRAVPGLGKPVGRGAVAAKSCG
jgi:hypothetical protein